MKKYNVIVVDPPWPIKKVTHKARPNQVSMDYSTMSLKEIATLNIRPLADNNCWIFLWTIQKFLHLTKPILEQFWGFNYLATGVWEKTYGRSAGMPLYGFRWNVEFFLVGYTKKPEIWPKRPLIPLGFAAPNRGHSQKPDEFYDMLSVLDGNKIDLFARKPREGWDVWGDEVESDPRITELIMRREK